VWESAPANGGSRIEKYILYIQGGQTDFGYELATPVNHYTYTDLAEKTDYNLTIAAFNANGDASPGNWWTSFTATTAIDGAPGDPGFLRLAPPPSAPVPDTDDNVSIAWNTASTNGGTNISGYEITWTPQ
jgi:hypothetical protein